MQKNQIWPHLAEINRDRKLRFGNIAFPGRAWAGPLGHLPEQGARERAVGAEVRAIRLQEIPREGSGASRSPPGLSNLVVRVVRAFGRRLPRRIHR